jgi:choline dehydrogenase-like flavoprotein
MKNEIGIGGVAHQAGTCHFGTDPKSSVLDTNCKAHELDNLYVVDTSFFPSIGRLTQLSRLWRTLRIGDHLIGRLK